MKADVDYLVDRAAECERCWGTGYTQSLSMSWTEDDFVEYACPSCSEPEEDI